MSLAHTVAKLIDAVGWALLHSLWQFTIILVLHRTAQVSLRSTAPTVRFVAAIAALSLCVVAVLATGAALAAGWFEQLLDTTVRDGLIRFGSPPTLPGTFVAFLKAADFLTPAVVVIWAGWFYAKIHAHLIIRRELNGIVNAAVPLEDESTRVWDDLRRKLSIAVAVRFAKTAEATTLTAVGWFRPWVLLPLSAMSKIPPSVLEDYIVHELVHIRRRDNLILHLITVLESAFWFNRPLFKITSDLRHLIEECCDETAIRVIGSRKRYGASLFATEQWVSPHPLALGLTGSTLPHRISRIVANADVTPRPARLSGVLFVLVLVTLLAGLGTKSAAGWLSFSREVVAISADPSPTAVYRLLWCEPSNPRFVPAVERAVAESEAGRLDLAAALRLSDAVKTGGSPTALLDASLVAQPSTSLRLRQGTGWSGGSGREWDTLASKCFEHAKAAGNAADRQALVRAALLISAQDRVNQSSYLLRLVREPQFAELSGLRRVDVDRLHLIVAESAKDLPRWATAFQAWAATGSADVPPDLREAAESRTWMQWQFAYQLGRVRETEPARADALLRSIRAGRPLPVFERLRRDP